MSDGRHLDVPMVQRARRADDAIVCGEPAFWCSECNDVVGTLIWCLDGKPRCVACAMVWRPSQ